MKDSCRILLTTLAVGVVLTLLSGCASLPDGARSCAMSRVQRLCDTFEEVCEDHRVTAASEEITAAEKKNGITDKWCVQVDYIYRSANDDEYYDNYWGPRLVVERGGHWEVAERCRLP